MISKTLTKVIVLITIATLSGCSMTTSDASQSQNSTSTESETLVHDSVHLGGDIHRVVITEGRFPVVCYVINANRKAGLSCMSINDSQTIVQEFQK